MSTQAGLGQKALQNRDYAAAVTHLTNAIQSSESPLWLTQRSTAYQRLGKHDLALADADNAVVAAIRRARRELVATAQFRRGVALHGLKRYGDARLCLSWCSKANEKEPGLSMWQAKVKNDYDAAGGEDAEVNKCTVKEVPDKVEEVKKDDGSQREDTARVVLPSQKGSAKSIIAPAQTPKEKIRHEWFQSSSNITITIFAKGVPKEEAEVIFEDGSLEVRFPVLVSSSIYDLTLSPLFAKIDTSKSTFTITPHKIEVTLHKSTAGLKWSALEGTVPIVPDVTEATTKPPLSSSQKESSEKAPSYPSSSRTGPKNWDALAMSALKAESTGKDKVSLEDDDLDEGDPMEGFFKQLYKNADPDTKRAMMKSYQESNGTALSTNWADVKKGPVETKPPEGVEAKKWGA